MKPLTATAYEALFNATPGFHLVLDPGYNIIIASENFLSLTGVTQKALTGKNISVMYDYLVPAKYQLAKEALARSLRQAVQQSKPQEMASMKFTSGEGAGASVKYFKQCCIPVYEQQQLTSFLFRLEDVTTQTNTVNGFNSFLEAVPDATIIIDEQGQINTLNQLAATMFGYTREELTGQSVERLMRDEVRAMHRQQRYHFAAAGHVRHMDSGRKLVAMKKDGSSIIVDISLSPIYTQEGLMIAASVRDITGQKATLQQLELLSLQINHSNDAIFTLDVQKRITSWNNGAEKMYGYSREEALGQDLFGFLNTDISPQETEVLINSLNRQEYISREFKRKTKEGADIFVRASITTLTDTNGAIAGFVSVNYDITEQRRLREQLHHLASITEQSSEAIISRDLDKKLISWNHGAEHLFGYSKQEAIGNTVHELGIVRFEPGELQAMEAALRQQGKWKSERSYYHKNGDSFWGAVIANAVKSEDGKLISEVFIIKDISAEKQLEQELKKSNEALEEKVKQRTGEIMRNERKYRYLFENSPLPMWVISLDDFRFLDVNEMAIVSYGYSREEFLSMTAVDIRPEEDKPLFLQSDHTEGRINNFNKGTWRHRKKNGSIIQVEIIAHHISFEGINARLILANDVTARLLAEEKLVASEEKFRTLIENNNDIINLVDESLNVFYRSPSSGTILGWTDDDIYGKSILSKLHPDELPAAAKVKEEVMAKPGIAVSCSFRLLHKNGEYLWLEGVIRNMLHDKNLKAIVFNFRDVTARKLAEEKLTGSEERYRTTLDQMLEGAQIIDFDWKYIYVNDAMARHARYSKEELIGHTVMEKFPGIENTGIYKVYQQCFTERVPVHLENEFVFPDGSVAWFELSFQPIPEGIFILSVDITQRKKAEETLIEKMAQLQTLGDNLTGVMIFQLLGRKDGTREFTYVSNGVSHFSGRTAEEVMKDPSLLYGLLLEEDLPAFIAAEAEANNTLSVFNQEVRCRNYKNEIRWLQIVSTPRRQQNGSVVWDGFHIDITERKLAEQQVQQMNAELEERVAKRTQQLKKSMDEMEAFSYSVSHDLRAPLRGIIGFTSILEEEYSSKLDAEAKRITGIIKSNTLRMGNLIDDLLSFSRVGQHELHKQILNTNDLVAQVIAGIELHGASIAWEIPGLHHSYADYTSLKQVWVNLLSNAVKYTQGAANRRIEAGSYTGKNETIFFVKDNGVGFDELYADKLFKVFQRLHSGNEFEGTGIGLAIVDKIVSKHGGRVWAKGTKNKGACFYFSLPDTYPQSV